MNLADSEVQPALFNLNMSDASPITTFEFGDEPVVSGDGWALLHSFINRDPVDPPYITIGKKTQSSTRVTYTLVGAVAEVAGDSVLIGFPLNPTGKLQQLTTQQTPITNTYPSEWIPVDAYVCFSQ